MARPDPLQEIPGIGPSISADLRALGIERVADLEGRDPAQLYQRLCVLRGGPVDRCVLYVFRCAVYYATEERHDPDLLLWWSWKGRTELDESLDDPATLEEPHEAGRNRPRRT